MSAHAASDPEAEKVVSSKDFDAFLDQLMFRLYDTIKEHNPRYVIPTMTMYRRANYTEPFQVASHQIPPTADTDQLATMQVLGASAAANFDDGRIPVAVFLVTMGQKQTPKIGTELNAQEIQENSQEVIMISGATIDGRMSRALYNIARDDQRNIVKIDLKYYMPSRPQYTEKSTVTNPLLAAFYQGHAAKYAEIRDKQMAEDGGPRNGDIILPN